VHPEPIPDITTEPPLFEGSHVMQLLDEFLAMFKA